MKDIEQEAWPFFNKLYTFIDTLNCFIHCWTQFRKKYIRTKKLMVFSDTFKETRKLLLKRAEKKILPYWNFVVFLYWLSLSFDKKKKRQEELLVMSGRESFPPSKITKKKKNVPGHQPALNTPKKIRRKSFVFVYAKQFFLSATCCLSSLITWTTREKATAKSWEWKKDFSPIRFYPFLYAFTTVSLALLAKARLLPVVIVVAPHCFQIS